MVSDDRMRRWVRKFEKLSPEAQKLELLRVEQEFYLPSRAPRLSYCSDLSRVPGESISEVMASGTNVLGEREVSEKIKALVQFIREEFGKRCARAAIAVMSGCYTGAEIGAQMGVTRQTAAEHLRKIRSRKVQRKAVQLGLVTRAAVVRRLFPARAR